MDPSESVDQPASALLAAVSALCLEGSHGSGTDGASVSLSGAGRVLSPVWATNATARAVEERQLTLGEGPCLDAAAFGRPVLVEDLRSPPGGATAWPAFLHDVTTLGVWGLFAFPLQMGVIVVGTLELYRRDAGRLSRPQLGVALNTADVLGAVLLGLGSGPAAADVIPPYRLVVHQAAGMLTVQLDVPIEEAMLRLRARAFSRGRSINDVAADVVSGRMLFEEGEA
jgi:hypothetical protein